MFITLATIIDGKPYISLYISENLVKEKGLNANNLIKELAKEINGVGGGQPFFATAGGKNVDNLQKVFIKAESILKSIY